MTRTQLLADSMRMLQGLEAHIDVASGGRLPAAPATGDGCLLNIHLTVAIGVLHHWEHWSGSPHGHVSYT